MIELYRPGWGIPGTVGGVCLLLFFLGHYVVHLAGWEELLLLGVGLLLLALEVFVIPGFGIAGIAGIVALLLSVLLSLVGRDLSVSWHFGYLTDALTIVSGGLLGTLVGGVLVVRFLPTSRIGAFFVLRRKLETNRGFVTHTKIIEEKFPVGTRGKASGDLRPAGKIRIAHDRLDAISEGPFVPRGTEVVIVAWRAGQPVVRRVEDRDGAEEETQS